MGRPRFEFRCGVDDLIIVAAHWRFEFIALVDTQLESECNINVTLDFRAGTPGFVESLGLRAANNSDIRGSHFDNRIRPLAVKER
jgi:hypothetical protein